MPSIKGKLPVLYMKWPKLYERVGEGNVSEIVQMLMRLFGIDSTEVARRACLTDRSNIDQFENWLEYKIVMPFARVSNILRAVGLRLEVVEDEQQEWPKRLTKAEKADKESMEAKP